MQRVFSLLGVGSRVDPPCEPLRPGPKAHVLAIRQGEAGREGQDAGRGNRGRAAVAERNQCGGVIIGASSLFSMVRGRGQETADGMLASQGASQAGHEEGPPHSERHCLKAGQEAEQEGGGHSCKAPPGAACPSPLGVLPGWGVAQAGLAAGYGRQGSFHSPAGGMARVCTPPRVGGLGT